MDNNNYNNDPYNTNYNANYNTFGNEPFDHTKVAKNVAYENAVLSIILLFIFAPLAIVFALQSLKHYKNTDDKKGRGLAISALTIASIEVFGTLTLILIVAILSSVLPDKEEVTNQDYRCAYAECSDNCIGTNCPCDYTDPEGNSYTIYCD